MAFKDRIQSAVQAFFMPEITKTNAWERAWLRGIESSLIGERLQSPYQQYEWVYVAVREIAGAVSQIPLKFYRNENEIISHELITAFESPNPLMDKYQFKEAIMTLLLIDGNAFVVPWNAMNNRGMPDQLWVFDRSMFRPLYNQQSGMLDMWELQDKPRTKIPANEVVHFKLYNPYDRLWGLSPITVARLSMETDYNSQTYTKGVIDNHAEPSGIITVDSPMTTDIMKVLRQQWEERHKGAKNSGKIAVLQKGMDYKSIAISQKDMQFLETRRYNREAILAIYQVPKGVVGITDDLNYATLWGQKKIFWQDTVMPYVRMLESGLNQNIIKRFDKTVTLTFDLSNVAELHEDFSEKVRNAEILSRLGVPFNQLNEKLELGFDDVPWGDTVLVPMNMMPIDMAGTMLPVGTNEPGKSGPKALPAIKSASAKEVLKFNHWVKFITSHEALERKFKSKIQRFFFEQRNVVLELLLRHSKSTGDYSAFIWDEQDEKLVSMVKPLYRDAAHKGSKLIADIMNVDPFAISNPLIDMKVEWRCNKITKINETIKGQIRLQLDAGLKTGESIQTLADRIKGVYTMAKTRALTIARTEVAGAMNDGEMLMMETEHLEQKEWLSARDKEVRESHQQEDGNVVAINDPFPVTGLQYPTDPFGPPEEVINCRCSLLPVID